jgi:hypothetical protein
MGLNDGDDLDAIEARLRPEAEYDVSDPSNKAHLFDELRLDLRRTLTLAREARAMIARIAEAQQNLLGMPSELRDGEAMLRWQKLGLAGMSGCNRTA